MTKCNTLKGAQAENGCQSNSGVTVEPGIFRSLDFIPVSLSLQPSSGAVDKVCVSSLKRSGVSAAGVRAAGVPVAGVSVAEVPIAGVFDFEEYDLHLWTADVGIITASKKFIVDQILTPDEVARASRFRFSKDSDLFISARAVLRLVLSQYLNLESRSICFTAGLHGKPLLSEQALKPLDFNVSHSGSRILIGVSRSDVGVDVEQLELDRNYDAIATRYFSEFERNTIASLSGVEKSRAFYNTWSRKEAFLKALGIGLSDHLDGFDVEGHPDRAASILAIRAAGGEWGDEKAENWEMYNLKVDESYAATAVVRASTNGDPVRAMAMEIADLIII